MLASTKCSPHHTWHVLPSHQNRHFSWDLSRKHSFEATAWDANPNVTATSNTPKTPPSKRQSQCEYAENRGSHKTLVFATNLTITLHRQTSPKASPNGENLRRQHTPRRRETTTQSTRGEHSPTPRSRTLRYAFGKTYYKHKFQRVFTEPPRRTNPWKRVFFVFVHRVQNFPHSALLVVQLSWQMLSFLANVCSFESTFINKTALPGGHPVKICQNNYTVGRALC